MQTTQGQPFSLYDLQNNPDTVQRQSLNTMWGLVKNRARSAASLMMLQKRRSFSAVTTKAPLWGVGDWFSDTVTLGAAFVAGTDTTVTVTEKKFVADDMVLIRDTNDTTNQNYALLRIGSYVGKVGSYYKYNCSTEDYGAAASIAADSATLGFLLSSAVTYDAKARDYLQVKADLAKNVVQRARDTFGSGQFERAEHFLVDHSLEHQTDLGYKFAAEKLNKALHLNMIAKGGMDTTTTGDDFGIMGGLPYIFNPHNATFSDSGGVRTCAAAQYDSGAGTYSAIKGQNRVDTYASTPAISYKNIRQWAASLSDYGSKDKMVFCSRLMFDLFIDALENRVVIQRMDYAKMFPTYADVWEMHVANMGYCNLWFVVDNGLNGVPMDVVDNTSGAHNDYATYNNQLYWMVAVDPEYIDIVPLQTAAGRQDMRIVGITQTDNDTVERVEVDWAYTVYCSDPRTGGYYALKAA